MTTILLGKSTEFDALVHGKPGCLPEQKPLQDIGDILTIASKDDGTVGKKPIIVIAFNVLLPDGTVRQVQRVMTVREFVGAYSAFRGRYGPGGPQSQRYISDESPFINYV